MSRARDLALALGLALLLALPAAALLLWLRLREGPPLFHVAPRAGRGGRVFRLWKLRSMRPAPDDAGVSGGDKAARVTATGRWLRRHRLDEIPQLWNVVRGDMGLVGPRPPLPGYAARFPALYGRVLASRPGITGLATLAFHAHEERLLARCASAAETEAVYVRRCIPRKARIDLLWQARRGHGLDLWLMALTLARAAGFGRGRRLPRRRPRRRRKSADR